jgi:hypothetical protein
MNIHASILIHLTDVYGTRFMANYIIRVLTHGIFIHYNIRQQRVQQG